ncbi:MAG: GNAT family N-acetyltransferase [Muribaculaceae bacterium]|nr:GNAT family N-acetyltransferase [Muribaculaceae bacterium]
MKNQEYFEIEAYEVVLKRLTHDKIELVRNWRNHPKISRYMEYREEITPEMQEAWFLKINNSNNFYFLITKDDKEIGLINVRDIDYEKGEGEPGIFIWDDDYINTPVSVMATLALTDFCFEELKLKRLIAHVLKDNMRAIKFNKAIGYKLTSGQEEIMNQEYLLVPDSYKIKKNRIIKYIR